ncbi:UNVERIFIED_CONTAM: hypothetical protein RMT77_001749 [Armadillidium vulgare]
MKFVWLCYIVPFLILFKPSCSVPKKVKQENGYCGMDGYEAHCVLDIMDEHIEATAVVNHCHLPFDITFRVIYRYGNGSEQRWQYTFVTTNQNERVLIPGLTLPPAPHAFVYLFVRVPPPIFDLHNSSLVAIKASFVAILAEDTWEEAQFLDEVLAIDTTEDCFTHEKRNKDPLLWIIGGALLGLLLVGSITTGVLWWHKRKKMALDELALVTSLETGLPGAQPYQIGTSDEGCHNNNEINSEIKEAQKDVTECQSKTSSCEESSKKSCGFRFNRLKEESQEERKEKIAKKLCDAVVIGNPVLISKDSALENQFNRVASVSPEGKRPLKNIESIGDAFRNDYCIDEEKKREADNNSNRTEETEMRIQKNWNTHPLEANGTTNNSTVLLENSLNTSSKIKLKEESKKIETKSHDEMTP